MSAAPPQRIVFPYSEPPLDAWRIPAQPAPLLGPRLFPPHSRSHVPHLASSNCTVVCLPGKLHTAQPLGLGCVSSPGLIPHSLSILLGIQTRLFLFNNPGLFSPLVLPILHCAVGMQLSLNGNPDPDKALCPFLPFPSFLSCCSSIISRVLQFHP